MRNSMHGRSGCGRGSDTIDDLDFYAIGYRNARAACGFRKQQTI